MNAADLDLGQLRERQVKVLSRALNQFVSLKSSPEGWQPVAPDSRLAQTASMGGDVDVHIGKKPLPASATGNDTNNIGDVYRMTASIPLDPDVSKDTQGPFSAYLSELRDWQAVLECPGLRSMWNYYIRSCSTLEMLDAHTSITRAELRSPAPGQPKEFAHQRDMMMVETSLVDPTTVIYVSTSLPTTEDDPAYLREQAPYKRVHSALWAWCVEIVTPPIDAIPHAGHMAAMTAGFGASQQLLRATAATSARAKPRVCVQVTCFLHLDLKSSWKSNNALACRAAANLIPSLVAHLRLHGAPPRIARIGPSVAVDKSEWHRPAGGPSVWEVSYSVMCTPRASDAAGGSGRRGTAQLPPPLLQTRSSAMSAGQPIIASILDLETTSPGGSASNSASLALRGGGGDGAAPSLHMRKVSTLTSYLSSSFQRRQGEAASAFGTHAGGIVRDGEELALVVTRARLGSCLLEFVVDASKWRSEGRAVDITLSLSGFASADQLYASISEMQAAAPELFTESQLRLTHSDVTAMLAPKQGKGGVNRRRPHPQEQQQQRVIAELAAMQLVRCFSIASHKNSRQHYLVRILNPPLIDVDLINGHENVSPGIEDSNGSAARLLHGDSADRTYRVAVVVRKGSSNDGNDSNSRTAGLVVNGHYAEIVPFTLDPPAYAALKPRNRAISNEGRALDRDVAPQRNSEAATPVPQVSVSESSKAPRLESAAAEMAPEVHTGNTTDECIAVSMMGPEADEDMEGTQSAAELSAHDLQTINRTAADAPVGGVDAANICDIPLARLHQVNKVPAASWSPYGTLASGGITVSRTDLRPEKEKQQQQQNEMRIGEGGSVANGVSGSSASVAVIAGNSAIRGTILRAEALIEGWTIFDVFSVLSIGNGTQEPPVSGLWTASQILEQVAPSAELCHRKTAGTWATTARDAVVCRVWTIGGRGNRIDVAECSIDELSGKLHDFPILPDTPNVIRADLGLCAWRLEKAKMPPVQPSSSDQQHGNDSARDHERPNRDAMNRMRLRSESTTGSLAIDAEVENQRRKQHAVKVVHYLRYNPRGWLSPSGAAVVAAGDEMAAGFRRMGTALGFGPPPPQQQQQQQQRKQPSMQDESAVFQTMLLPMLKDAVSNDITRVVQHLDEHGARPAVVWSRNANVISTDATRDSVQVQYRMAGWGAAGSGKPAVAETLEQNEFVEIEMRIEHRVWAHGQRTDSATERMAPASIRITAEPFYESSAVACFVDPETDPHATRVRVSHHRSQLLPRVEESDDGIFMAWPTVRLVVSRRTSDTKQAQPSKLSTSSSSSLVIPAVAAPLPSKGGAPSPIAPWSVPPRISMNSVDARVRYLRRDSAVHAFYARCQSVAPRDIARLVCGPPRAGELFMERLPDPVPQQPDPSAAAASPAQADSNGGNADDDAGDFSRIAIEKYSVHGTGHHHRVATPNQFASVMAGVFARIRHELELADPRSARSRWEHLRSQRRDSGMRSGDGDARSVASLVTATADEGWRNVRGQPGGAHAATYQRIVDGLHSEIPVTVAVDVLQGVSAADAARLLEQPWERAEWDTSLFDGRTRRELEYVPGVAGSGGVGVCHSRMHVPLLCDRRDALTVHVTERAAFLPTRRRVRNWEEAHSARSPIAPRSQAGCGNSAATLGDYHDATFTLVEASVPGSQPLSTTVRATVALYAVRVDPIDAFERVVGGRPLALQACRITVACCVDLAGAMPLPLRRAASARVPGQHISQIRARLLQRLSLWPLLAAPSRSRHVAPRLAGSASEGAVAAQVSEQVVDGQRMAFHAALDGSRVVHEAVVSKGSKRAASYVAVVALPQASAAAKARADAHGRPLCSLRKDGDSSDSDANCNDESPLRLFPVVSDVVIGSAATSCFAHGFDINVTTSLSGNLQPIAEASGFAGGGGGGEPSSLWNGSRRREAASRVAGQAAAIPAARWAGDVGECCRLAVYVFALARDGGGRSAELLVRTVLLPPDDEDGGSVELQCAPAESPGATAGSRRPKAAASCTVVIRAACEESRTRAPATAASTPGSMAIPSFAAALDPLGSSRASNQDEGDMPAVWCNGQRLRIHEAMPPKQSLLFVATTDGKRLYACRQCGGLGCDAHEDSGAKGSDGPDTGMAAVGYASDTEDIFVQDGGGLAAVVGQQNADGSGVLAGGEQQQQQQQQPQTQQQQQQQMAVGGRRQCSVPTILLSGGDGQAPRVASLSSSSAAALSVGQGLGTTLRRRIVGGGSSRSSSASAAIFAATTDSNGSKPPTSSSLGMQTRQWTVIAGPDKTSIHWTADIAGRIPIKRIVLAAFLPVRRLVIGRNPKRESSERSGAVAARKSALALALVLVAGGVCVLVGMRVCQMLVIARLP